MTGMLTCQPTRELFWAQTILSSVYSFTNRPGPLVTPSLSEGLILTHLSVEICVEI
ncbi:uncharacterized protein PHALS_12601 [Plasmopara halstedii]|uniref:Uncharacterized protein n=1 Tax=Plasmopara halstedii TaxID=4781 RepID=A0A0P1ANM3_PLAHL|nr:uncharacterized protein PHALS_12601 [Plasmopara halstedii]CEG42319.1 hypothetical protein PHALS_12601 [Plasmopara halstedii]|eukprot:XP_024578688.1 hypothetical protein PHALS_12601 [Plasmopara halstedii]